MQLSLTSVTCHIGITCVKRGHHKSQLTGSPQISRITVLAPQYSFTAGLE